MAYRHVIAAAAAGLMLAAVPALAARDRLPDVGHGGMHAPSMHAPSMHTPTMHAPSAHVPRTGFGHAAVGHPLVSPGNSGRRHWPPSGGSGHTGHHHHHHYGYSYGHRSFGISPYYGNHTDSWAWCQMILAAPEQFSPNDVGYCRARYGG